MKWDWERFQSQPNWFIDIILAMLREEAEEISRRNKK